MEAMNRKLTEELATTRREQKEQMRQILERLGERPQPWTIGRPTPAGTAASSTESLRRLRTLRRPKSME